jgi:hypothetical protein
MLELRAITDTANPFGAATTSLETALGCRIKLADLAFTGSVGLGLASGVGTPTVRSTLAVEWAPRVHDRDSDRVPDDSDECPPLPEDFDGFEDEDGCPDPDNDGDLVLDQDDLCPIETAEEGRDEDEDGCTDAVRDTDGDGVEDGSDACPSAAEDRDEHDDEDGCPDLDDDADGVPDASDACLTEPETVNGVSDDDGCADRGGRVYWRATGTPAGADARLVGSVAFDRSGAVAASAAPALDQLARILRGWQSAQKHWQVAIAAGSDARTAALTAALVSRGLAAENIHVTVDAAVRGAQVVVSPTPAPSSAPKP